MEQINFLDSIVQEYGEERIDFIMISIFSVINFLGCQIAPTFTTLRTTALPIYR